MRLVVRCLATCLLSKVTINKREESALIERTRVDTNIGMYKYPQSSCNRDL